MCEGMSTNESEVAFADDGDEDHYLQSDTMSMLFGKAAITHFWICNPPEPPTDD